MSITADDCKIFITDFLKRNIQVLDALYGANEDYAEPDDIIYDIAFDVSHWRVDDRRPPEEDDAHPGDDRYAGVYSDGVKPNRYGETTGMIRMKNIAWVWESKCGTDTDLGFLIFETTEGELHLGPHRD